MLKIYIMLPLQQLKQKHHPYHHRHNNSTMALKWLWSEVMVGVMLVVVVVVVRVFFRFCNFCWFYFCLCPCDRVFCWCKGNSSQSFCRSIKNWILHCINWLHCVLMRPSYDILRRFLLSKSKKRKNAIQGNCYIEVFHKICHKRYWLSVTSKLKNVLVLLP